MIPAPKETKELLRDCGKFLVTLSKIILIFGSFIMIVAGIGSFLVSYFPQGIGLVIAIGFCGVVGTGAVMVVGRVLNTLRKEDKP